MPVTQRRTASVADAGINAGQNQAAIDAAISTPARKKRSQASNAPFLTSFDLAPEHVKDNEFILRGYRAGHNFKTSITSVFRLHNETGNIWTHLLGFLLFICLTVATFHLRPAPLTLGADALATLETRLASLGKRASLYDLVASAETWERNIRQYSTDTLDIIEEKLRSIRHHNLAEVALLADSVGSSIKRYSASGKAKLAQKGAIIEEKLTTLGSEVSSFSSVALHDVEIALHNALASVLSPGSQWPVSRWPMYVFTAGACLCLLTSAVCHVFGCCAAHIASIMWRFDYAGIAILIVASFFPPVYYGFLCRPGLRATYLLITSILGASTLSVTLLERFQGPSYHPYRAALFVGLGLWGIVPITHAMIIHAGTQEVHLAMQLDGLMGLIYIGGAAIYATRVPERFKPGAFDMAFHSHQLFHVCVVIAAVIHYKASHGLLRWRDATGGCMSL
jgi:adiponectin receptor